MTTLIAGAMKTASMRVTLTEMPIASRRKTAVARYQRWQKDCCQDSAPVADVYLSLLAQRSAQYALQVCQYDDYLLSPACVDKAVLSGYAIHHAIHMTA